MSGKWIGGKGSMTRPTDPDKWERGWEAAFGKDTRMTTGLQDGGTFTEFEDLCDETWRGTPEGIEPLMYLALAINGEAGELAEEVKKMHRDEGGVLSEDRRHALLLEAGDVLYYLSRLANTLGLTLENVADMNVTKLHHRHLHGKDSHASD